jgi:hypothetical protein
MSKPNKVNKNNYDQAGRLTPDDMARARKRQGSERARTTGLRDRIKGKAGPDRGARGATRPRSAPEE